MNRFKKAWLSLLGRHHEVKTVVKVEERFTERIVIGEAVQVTVYQALDRSYNKVKPAWDGNIYTSCTQAFGECGSMCTVVSVPAIKVGSEYFFGKLEHKKVQPESSAGRCCRDG